MASLALMNKVPHLRVVPGKPEDAPAEISDEVLIAAVEAGDDRVAGNIYDLLAPTVDRTLFRVFGVRGPDHDDLVQMAFEQIIITLTRQTFNRGCSLKTWASSVTAHVGLNALRSQRRERQHLDRRSAFDADLNADPVDELRRSEARSELERLRDELCAMKPERSNTVFLHDVMGHELAEIALITGVTVAAAQSRLVRGRKELHQRIASIRELGGDQ